MDIWPVSLQQLLNSEDFALTLGDTTIRSNQDVGPDKIRSRMTKRIDIVQCSINVDSTQYSTLEDFYSTILGNGTLPFQMKHPITGVTKVWRFKQALAFKPLGGLEFQASMALEIIPS